MKKKEVVRMIKPHFRKARFCSGISFACIARTVPFHAIGRCCRLMCYQQDYLSTVTVSAE